MNDKFWKAMTFVSEAEWGDREDGGYTNHPDDPGGETKYGISKRAHPMLDIKNLTLDQAMNIYWKDYWFPIHGDDLPIGLAIACFDSAVLHGIGRTQKWMKQIDGSWRKLLGIRRIFVIDLVNKKPPLRVFLKGWLNRLNRLDKYITITEQDELLPP